MSKFKGARKEIIKSLRDFRSFSLHKKSATQTIKKEVSTSVQQNMVSPDLNRKRSSGAFSTISLRRDRQAQAQGLRQGGREEGSVYTPPQTSNLAGTQGPFTPARAGYPENRAQMQARYPPLSDFGPYEDHNINDCRRLRYLVQHGVFFQICITLEGAIFDFTKEWAPEFLASKSLGCAQEVELTFWERYFLAPIIPVEAFENCDNIPRYHELLNRFRESRHTLVHRMKSPVLYIDQMLVDSIQLTRMIGDETRTEKLDKMYQISHHMGSLLRRQATTEAKGILEDRLQTLKQTQDIAIDWLEVSRNRLPIVFLVNFILWGYYANSSNIHSLFELEFSFSGVKFS